MTTILLLIYKAQKAIQYTWALLNFIILTQYILNNKKMFCYREYPLYRLKKTKILFE